MSDDVKLIIVGTFVIVGLAWVATHASELGGFTQSLGTTYASGVNALKPSGA